MLTCGLDFGTSNSALAVARPDGPRLIDAEDGQPTLPSALFFPANSTAVPAYGRAAQSLFYQGEEGRFMRSLKRILGTALMNQGTAVNGRMMKFDDIIAGFICHLRGRAAAQADTAPESVVMGRPVHFADADAALDARAEEQLAAIARKTGFRHVAFQYEPIAAAFAHEIKIARETLAVVIDIGGGTSDFTVIRVCRDHAAKPDRSGDILGNSGIRTGGNDFDKQLSLHSFMPHFGLQTTYGEKALPLPLSPFHDMSEWSKVNFLYTPKFRREMENTLKESHAADVFGRYVRLLQEEKGHRLLAAVEESKIGLTGDRDITVPLDFIEKDFSLDITRRELEYATQAELSGIRHTLQECLRKAGVAAGDIGLVILTGGPTEMPAVRTLVADLLPQAAVSEENKLSSVALGLAQDARRKFA